MQMKTVLDEVQYAIVEAKRLNMGTDAPTVKIIEHAAKLAMVPVDWVENVYYNELGEMFEETDNE